MLWFFLLMIYFHLPRILPSSLFKCSHTRFAASMTCERVALFLPLFLPPPLSLSLSLLLLFLSSALSVVNSVCWSVSEIISQNIKTTRAWYLVNLFISRLFLYFFVDVYYHWLSLICLHTYMWIYMHVYAYFYMYAYVYVFVYLYS